MPDSRGADLSGTDYYYRRRIDPRVMAAARKVAEGLGMPTKPFDPSVINSIVRADPLLAGPDATARRLWTLESLNLKRGVQEVEVHFPIEARALIERIADEEIYAWKRLQLDPFKFYMATVIDMSQP